MLQPPTTLQDLDQALERLRAASLLDKAAAAEHALTTARAVLGHMDARLRALELSARQSVRFVP